jgi:hypothetical protein
MLNPMLTIMDDQQHPRGVVDTIAVYNSNFLGYDLLIKNYETYLQPINLDEIIVEIMVLVKLFIKNDNSNSKKDRNKEIEG